MKARKKIKLIAMSLMLILSIVGCSNKKQTTEFNADKEITVIARDAASGTRGAFHELMKIKVKEKEKESDNLAVGALEFDGTDKVITAVEKDKYAIGYISIGSLSDRVKPASINGLFPTEENVKNGNYVVSRPYLLLTNGIENDLVKDFLSFTKSVQGQEIVKKMHYIGAIESPKQYEPSNISGTIKVAGSTSVAPLMEKIQEAYKDLNPNVTFEMQANGSSQGIKAAIEGTYDIGMSSRNLKDDEKSKLNEHTLAIDGIAVIINKTNPKTDLSSENITKIYTGEITKWSEVN